MFELIISHMANFTNKNLIKIKFALKIVYHIAISHMKNVHLLPCYRVILSLLVVMDITCSSLTHKSR